jgi:hypothetical protein
MYWTTFILALLQLAALSLAFLPPRPAFVARSTDHLFFALARVSDDESQVPIPFVDTEKQTFIECFADSVAELDGKRYTIGIPCDHSVAICYFDGNQLIPVELEDDLMDDVFPVAESIVNEEFGEELVLQRTPQTLTLVGELDDEDEDDDDVDEEDDDNEEEEVEVLLSFEHRDMEFNLVRLLDPVLLVGKDDQENPSRRLLLTPEESDAVMPRLEDMFVDYEDDDDDDDDDKE